MFRITAATVQQQPEWRSHHLAPSELEEVCRLLDVLKSSQHGSLRDKRLKGKGKGALGKGVLGSRETRGTQATSTASETMAAMSTGAGAGSLPAIATVTDWQGCSEAG